MGGGPAGCLAATLLHATGRRVLLLHRSRGSHGKGAGAHAHRIPSESWLALERILPGLHREVIEAGATQGSLHCLSAGAGNDAAVTPWLSRRLLDRLMRRRTAAAGVIVKDVSALHVAALTTRQWEIDYQPADGRSRIAHSRAPLLVDASGSARAALAGVAGALGSAIPLLQVPGQDHYWSVRLADIALPWGAGALSLDSDRAGRVIIQRLESGSDDGATHLLTCIVRGESRGTEGAKPTPTDLLSALSADPELADMLANARPVAPPNRFGPLPIQLLQMHRVGAAAPDWLALGDALLVTPPAKGLGIAWAVLQAERLRAGLDAGLESDELRRSLGEFAEAAWLSASFEQALEDDGFHPRNSFDLLRDQSEESCHA
ncbi:MAG: hypothetical protein JJU27_06510 [Gammaproteobacteria bacterium]|nr:hypothetical protein [Gammaproteobacteria bacterium]